MEFIHRLLAKRFSYFESVSGFILWPLWIVVIFAMMVSLSFIEGTAAKIVEHILVAVFFVSYAGITSARYFARKKWMPTSPLIVQFSSKAWFNSIISIFKIVNHWITLIFVHLILAMAVLYFIAQIFMPFLIRDI